MFHCLLCEKIYNNVLFVDVECDVCGSILHCGSDPGYAKCYECCIEKPACEWHELVRELECLDSETHLTKAFPGDPVFRLPKVSYTTSDKWLLWCDLDSRERLARLQKKSGELDEVIWVFEPSNRRWKKLPKDASSDVDFLTWS
jgi:hypothetical protein